MATSLDQFLQARRAEAWPFGEQHRESLLREHMQRRGLTKRPLLHEVVEDLIEDIQGARLVEEVLPLNTYAQTESEGGRIRVVMNSRVAEIPRVKDPKGVRYVTLWHESIHVALDMNPDPALSSGAQLGFSGIQGPDTKVIACRTARPAGREQQALEFFAENAGLAAAIAEQDLQRCPAYRDFLNRMDRGGVLPWPIAYDIARFIGVNIRALNRYLDHRGFARVADQDGKSVLVAAKALVGVDAWKSRN